MAEKPTKIIHVVWAPTGPIVGYYDPTIAHAHARTMLGVDVTSIELRDSLPDVVREDLSEEWEGDEDTPQVVDIDFNELD